MSSTEQLAELIRDKRQVLTQLQQIGVRQGELVAAGDVGTLLKLLGAKQRLLAELQRLEQRIKPYRDEDPERRVWASPAHRAACAADADACRSLLAEVMEMERRHEQQMAERRDRVANQLQQAHTAQNASGAYRTHAGHAAPPTPALSSPPPSLALDQQPATGGLDLTSEA